MEDKKDKMLNVRLDKATDEELNAYAENQGASKSSIVKEALAMYFSKEQTLQYPHALGKDLFGAASSGTTDNSSKFKQRVKSKINEKHAH